MKQKFLDFIKDKEIFYMFLYKLSVRRHFIPILSIYYITLPNTTLNQIWIFTWIWYIFWMLLEVPSGYVSDTIGHKKTLFLSRIFMILSLMFFILGWTIFRNLWFILFTLWTVFMNIWFSFNSGTITAFFYEIIEKRWDENKFTKINSRLNWIVSLSAVFFLILLPFTLKINELFPFVLNMIFDFIWIIALLKLPDPRDSKKIIIWKNQKFRLLLKDSINLWFLPFMIFIWLIWGVSLWKHWFDTVYLEFLWLLPIYIGFLMWISRLFRFILSIKIHKIEKKFKMKQILLFQIFLFSWWLLIISYTNNYFIVLIILAFLLAFKHSIGSINTRFIYKNYLKNTKYKATISSVNSFIWYTIWVFISFILWYIMQYSFKLWYLVLWIFLFISLSISYHFFTRMK
jgi:MFS family permease